MIPLPEIEKLIQNEPTNKANWFLYSDWLAIQGDHRGKLLHSILSNTKPHDLHLFDNHALEQAWMSLWTIQDTLNDIFPGPELAIIPKGSFLMGSPETEAWRSEEEILHTVEIEQVFAVGKYPITIKEFIFFLEDTEKTIYDNVISRNKNFPITNITLEMAFEYCHWLSEKTGFTYRLPSEAEWEYVARAGSNTCYWWGSHISQQHANYNYWFNRILEVKHFLPNRWGLYQVHGNIWEWTGSLYANNYYYSESIEKKINNQSFVIRGGSWRSHQMLLRSASRNEKEWYVLADDIGFRIVREIGNTYA